VWIGINVRGLAGFGIGVEDEVDATVFLLVVRVLKEEKAPGAYLGC